MIFRRYSNGEMFLNAAINLIEKDEALNNLIYAISESNLAIGPERTNICPIFITVNTDNDKNVIIAAVMSPPNRMVIYSQEKDEKTFQFIVKNIIENNIQTPGVLGPRENAIMFSEIWKRITGKGYTLSMKERVYKISKLNELSHPTGLFRNATEDDFIKVLEWTSAFMIEAQSISYTKEGISKFVTEKIKSQSLYVWEDKNIVSMAASTRPTQKSISINYVYTPEIYRRNGYARSCVAKLTQKLLDEGYEYCTLFTDQLNPTSNKIYKEIGYEEVGEILAIDFNYDNTMYKK